ncbi:MAG: Na+/H+ antiporter NhaA [Gammaproteobacteria bacterium]|nr:Na+/H+ antiporter NhaA [Gammaproteobacteria bacterium]MDH3970909.1 Na+/H+ antiporter NhaA [Gammaproteobacteria bacterium]MDH3986310.1 Na+/H+ antiporter NhaA [Gammaproteobacteria bacterium]
MSNSDKFRRQSQEDGVYVAPWERAFKKVLTPFEEFIHRQTTSGLLLMIMAVLALILANSPLAYIYQQIQHIDIGLSVGSWSIENSLHHWVNDGLMALFFFVVGLELKREIMVGELANPRQAALPIVAAIGGMVVPALIYFALNPEGDAARGWGIPMATDIAFALGAIALLARRVPKALITFLVALAIVDDLGAVMVIAVFYTETLSIDALLAVAAIFAMLMVLNIAGVRKILPYFILSIFLWYAMYLSGVHATLAGVLGAFSVPARPKYNPDRFSQQVSELMQRFNDSHVSGQSIMTNDKLRAIVQTLGNGIHEVEAPLQRLEHAWHLPVAYLVIPIFALFNAGIPLNLSGFGETLMHPVTMGVSVGLIAGKIIGIAGSCWIALKLNIGVLPAETRFTQIIGVSLLGGIGFTMSIFIAELGFIHQPELLLMAKTGILFASLVAGMTGFIWLYLAGSKNG